jgi:hypothetical protein
MPAAIGFGPYKFLRVALDPGPNRPNIRIMETLNALASA